MYTSTPVLWHVLWPFLFPTLGFPGFFSVLLQADKHQPVGACFSLCTVQVKIKNLCNVIEIYYVNAWWNLPASVASGRCFLHLFKTTRAIKIMQHPCSVISRATIFSLYCLLGKSHLSSWSEHSISVTESISTLLTTCFNSWLILRQFLQTSWSLSQLLSGRDRTLATVSGPHPPHPLGGRSVGSVLGY